MFTLLEKRRILNRRLAADKGSEASRTLRFPAFGVAHGASLRVVCAF